MVSEGKTGSMLAETEQPWLLLLSIVTMKKRSRTG